MQHTNKRKYNCRRCGRIVFASPSGDEATFREHVYCSECYPKVQESYEKSPAQKKVEQNQQTPPQIKCPDCDGTGRFKDNECQCCGGTGKIRMPPSRAPGLEFIFPPPERAPIQGEDL